MQRVRKFLVVKDIPPIGRKLSDSALSSAVPCEGWHKTWDMAVEANAELDVARTPNDNGAECVVIADESLNLVVAVFSRENLEALDPIESQTKWRSVKISAGEGPWCNFNYSDYGWGWVSGAEREVPFRLRFFERKAESNPNSILARTRAWVLEVRDWFKGHDKKIG